MRCEFLSDEWFARVDELMAKAGDLDIPPAMKAVDVNVTITRPEGDVHLFMKDGVFTRGHRDTAGATLTVGADLARRIFVDADVHAGVQGYLAGEIKIEGDLARVVAMQTVEPSAAQRRLTQQIADITA
jgi:hypothetical protein